MIFVKFPISFINYRTKCNLAIINYKEITRPLNIIEIST